MSVIIGIFVGIVAMLSGLLAVSEKRRRTAESEKSEAKLKITEGEIEKAVSDTPISDVVDDFNKLRHPSGKNEK